MIAEYGECIYALQASRREWIVTPQRVAAKLGGMPTAVRVGMFDQTIRVRVTGRFLIGQNVRCRRT